MIVLDASALLAFLFREPGHEAVARVLDRAVMSTVNLAEVLARFARDGHDVAQIRLRLESGAVELVPFDAVQAQICANLLPTTRSAGLSLGDRACLALASARGCEAMTADRAWAALDVGVVIRTIR
ncbi:MAG: type II toxin-antitoxin system VapC family toxin [Deltaproteobacteria bacterium]|nr:type II toxin-antitoxin system VapC family toxin [Deltaproteobacteria bacterium]